jgi:hypothetical protein
MAGNHERRQFWRANFKSRVRVTTHETEVFAQLIDISLKGALLLAGASWHPVMGEECQLRLDLGPGTTISVWGTVVHIAGKHIGLRSDNIDLDSITHLRRLVELNAGDPEILEREIGALLGE